MLALIDSAFRPEGITFAVTHVKADGSMAYRDKATAKFDRGNLIVTASSGAPGGGKSCAPSSKDPWGPDPIP